jgi:hexosaminidase
MRRITAVVLAALALGSCAKTATVVVRPPASPRPAARAHAVLPLPRSIEFPGGAPFIVTGGTAIVVPAGDDRVAAVGRFLSDLIGLAAASTPPRVVASAPAAAPGAIVLSLDAADAGDEGYELTIAADRVTIAAAQPAGLFYGVQTLRQLMPPFVEFGGVRPDRTRRVTAPAARIVDRPRFAWRGAMLDVARHFFTVDEVKRYIDLVSLHRFNRLHLHLSDDQGWRIDIVAWPNLARHGGTTEVGGGAGGYYTQAQYSEIVAYAADRFVTIVPEIDMPGHTNAALASYAELNCSGKAADLYIGIEVGFSALCVASEVTYRFIDDVVREIAALTPGPYFHVGGDEVKTLSAADYTAFIERVQRIVESHGKQTIGWDEVAAAKLRPGTIVQHWRPDAPPAAAIASGHRVIVSSANRLYVDMKYDAGTPIGLTWAGAIELRTAYDWDPATLFAGVPEASIAGVEAPLWSETVTSMREVEYLAFPRLAAVAEVAWSPAAARNWDDFRARLGAQAPRWAALGVNFYRAPEVEWQH